ncbi:MAG: hypothetical protein SFX74_10775 [Fimbriimonadaceae bacterium]|nr:hypothetical protein [Fimbriimonadaceae bacterium]
MRTLRKVAVGVAVVLAGGAVLAVFAHPPDAVQSAPNRPKALTDVTMLKQPGRYEKMQAWNKDEYLPVLKRVQSGDRTAVGPLVELTKTSYWNPLTAASVARDIDRLNDARCLEIFRNILKNLMDLRESRLYRGEEPRRMPIFELPALAEYLLLSEKYGKGEQALTELKLIMPVDDRAGVLRAAANRFRQEDDTPHNRAAAGRLERLAVHPEAAP